MIRLHHVPGSRSFRILWLLEELGLGYDLRLWSLSDGTMRSPELRAHSPAGRVPALETDGRAIFESGAIAEYLCEREGKFAPAPGSPERADFLEWLHFSETQAAVLQNLNVQHIFLRPVESRSPVLMRFDTRRLAVTAQALEIRLSGRDHVLDSGFSAADCMLGFNVPALFRFLPRADYPMLDAWWARMAARPACARALAADGPSLYTQDFYELPDV